MLESLTVHRDSRGFLFEVLRRDNPNFTKFGQVYFIGDAERGVVRAWHRHFRMDEWFCCVRGEVDFVLYDTASRAFSSFRLSGDSPGLLFAPREVFHGHKALSDDALILAVCTEPYDQTDRDEERVPPDHFQYDWGGEL